MYTKEKHAIQITVLFERIGRKNHNLIQQRTHTYAQIYKKRAAGISPKVAAKRAHRANADHFIHRLLFTKYQESSEFTFMRKVAITMAISFWIYFVAAWLNNNRYEQ